MTRTELRTSLFFIALFATGSAHAAPDATKLAAERFREAAAAFARGEYASAATTWEEAAALDLHPATLLDAAEAWERAGEWVRAAEDCDRVLAIPALGDSFRTDAERHLTTLAGSVATLELRGPDAFTARIDGGAALALPSMRRVLPGAHRILFLDKKAATSSTSELVLAAGETRLVDATPKLAVETQPNVNAAVAKTPKAPRDESLIFPQPTTGSWIGLAIAGGALGVSAVFGAFTAGAKSDYYAHPTADLRDDFHRDKAITNISVAVAGVSILAALVFARWHRPASAAEATTARSP